MTTAALRRLASILMKNLPAGWQRSNRIFVCREALIFASFFFPFAIATVLAAANGKTIFDIVPHYVGGDEVGRYRIVDSLLKYGKILGCYGYNLSCAHIPQYGNPWAIVWTFPYVAFGAVFGWDFNSPIQANLFFCGVANVAFMLLVNCSMRSIVCLLLANCFLLVNIHYSMTAMSESVRYALAIILSGMVYRLIFFDTGKFYRYVAVPCMCAFASFLYIILSFYSLIYLFMIGREMKQSLVVDAKKKAFSFIMYVCIMAFFSLYVYVIWYINALFTPDYFFQSGQGSIAGKEGLWKAGEVFVQTVSNNIAVIKGASGSDLWFAVLCCAAFMYLLVCLIFRKKLHSNDRKIVYLSTFILIVVVLGCVVGHAALYGGTNKIVLVREINVAICSIVYLAALLKDKRLFVVLALMSGVYAPTFLHAVNASWDNSSYKYMASIQREQVMAKIKEVEARVCDTGAVDPWENTAALFAVGPEFLFLPSCLSTNLVVAVLAPNGVDPLTLAKKCRFAFFGKGYESEALFKRFLIDGYTIVDKSEMYALLKRER